MKKISKLYSFLSRSMPQLQWSSSISEASGQILMYQHHSCRRLRVYRSLIILSKGSTQLYYLMTCHCGGHELHELVAHNGIQQNVESNHKRFSTNQMVY